MDIKGSEKAGLRPARILVFAGTAEGRRIAEHAAEYGHAEDILYSVATEYGKELLEHVPGARVRCGRLGRDEMRQLMEETGCEAVIDATHPYAEKATETITAAAEITGIEYIRLLREEDDLPKEGGSIIMAKDANDAARLLSGCDLPFLLTTGSKDLAGYSAVPGFSERCVVRVLPTEDSLKKCEQAGIDPARIIAMQGPFSEEMNLATMQHYGARIIVTKSTGRAGGFAQKAALAKMGYTVIVVGRPTNEKGHTTEEVLGIIDEILTKG